MGCNWIALLVVFIPVTVILTLNQGMVPLDKFQAMVSKTEMRSAQLRGNHSARFEEDGKPLLILHVGPSKTGTTTVQWFGQTNDKLMESDNLYYVGHNGHKPTQDTHRVHSVCLSGSKYDEKTCKKMWEDLERILDDHHSQNHTVLLSEERFSYAHREEMEKDRLWKHLVPLQRKWNVRVVFTYRRYFEWLPSKYYQSFNPKGGSRYEENLAKRSEWPDMNGKVIPSFSEYFYDYSNKWYKKHPESMKRKYEARFDTMWFFNMHKKGPFLPNFFCEMIPEAVNTCSYLRTEYSSVVKNPSTSKHLHFDMIAVEAYNRGWLNKTLERKDVAQAVEDFSVELGYTTMTAFPLDCLSPAQEDSLLKQSLSFEAETVPEFYASAEGEAALRDAFAQSKENHKFCTVDVEAVVEDPRWEAFFKKMSPE